MVLYAKELSHLGLCTSECLNLYYLEHTHLLLILFLLCNYQFLQIDVVYVGTIHPTHFPVVQLMLDAGKPVVCEKPLTMNAEDTNTLIRKAKDTKLFLMEVSCI